MKRAATLLALISIVVDCRADGEAPDVAGASTESVGDAVHVEECDWRAPRQANNTPESDPPCAIEFREVARLEGDLNSVIPRSPITVLADGTFITATYQQGRLARWTSDGAFMHALGNGPGEGPGEFNHATGLAQVNEGEVIVLTGLRTVHWYSTDGSFLRSLLLPSYGGAGGAVVYRDAAIIGTSTRDGREGFALEGLGVRSLGLLSKARTPLLLAATEEVGIWSAVYDRYVLRRHAWPTGTIVDSITMRRDWFPGPDGNEANLFNLHADSRGLIWVPLSVADPQAPDPWYSPEAEVQMGDLTERIDQYTDFVIEALTPDGDLVASVRFDAHADAAGPIHGDLWYRVTEDEQSIVVLKALLTVAPE